MLKQSIARLYTSDVQRQPYIRAPGGMVGTCSEAILEKGLNSSSCSLPFQSAWAGCIGSIWLACRSKKCFQGWWSYLKLALPSVGACCLEWWLYEGLILMAGWFPNADVAVAAMGVGFNTTALTYTISQGMGGKRPCYIVV